MTHATPRFPRVCADLVHEHVFVSANWFDIVNTTRRVLARAGLKDEAIEFESDVAIAVGRSMDDNDGATFAVALSVAQRFVVVKLPPDWTREVS